MVFDTFLFYNELDLLEIRLNTLWDVVDYFVIAEATLTHQKESKPLFFKENRQRFQKYDQKIIHVIIDDDIENYGTLEPWKYQRNCIRRGLQQCGADDKIILSDLDEIPEPRMVLVAKESNQTILFRQQLYYYFVDCRSIELDALPWSIMFRFGDMDTVQGMRDLVINVQANLMGGTPNGVNPNVVLLDNAGWHFSYLGGVDAIIQKIEAFADAEFNLTKFKKREEIYNAILNGRDIYGRELSFEFVNGTDHLPVYLRENMHKYASFFRSSLVPTMIFDQYSRYKACSDLLRQAGFAAGNTVLDIGSGPECLFGQFMPDANMSYVDPLIPVGAGKGRITGNVFVSELDGQTFDCVSAVDVLEHVPPEYRKKFVQRLASLGNNIVILGFPTSDSSDALETDKAIDNQYKEVFGHEYSWLEEHYRYGLPSMADTVQQLTDLGWHCQTVGHGHAPWLRELLGFVVCVWDIPAMSNLVQEISEQFNRELYAYDFLAPHYRQFVIASRVPLPQRIECESKSDRVVAEATFRALMDKAHSRYFEASLRQLAERDAHIVALNKKIKEASAWGMTQQAAVEERDSIIGALNKTIADASDWGAAQQAVVEERDRIIEALNKKIVDASNRERSLNVKLATQEKALSDKQAELMKMSDWAQGMMLELNRRNSLGILRIKQFARRVVAFLRRKLSRSFIGDLVRHARDVWRCRKNRISLDSIRQSVVENNGRLIIAFPVITWNFRWQRPQHIVSGLSARGFSVLYVAMSLSPLGRRLRSTTEALSLLSFSKLAPSVNKIWLNSSKHINVYTDPIKDEDLLNISMGLEALISELNPKSIVYLIQFPGWGPVALDLRSKLGGKVIFDCMDDHGGFSTNTQEALETEEMLTKSADLVITSSNVLEEKAKVLNPSTIQVKNGTEFEHFTNPVPNGELDYLRNRPIIGYYGAISDWFDMEIVAHCARQRPDWNFVLVGATAGADLQPIADLNNVHLIGEIPYKELPGYFAYFDVCTIPFKIIPLTLATNPVKFYEYLSAGKPVVSVALPELIPYQEDCYLAESAEEFLQKLEQAYAERNDENKIRSRLKLAGKNSWNARVSAILESDVMKLSLAK